jgi:hypothetical protein
VAQSLCNAVVLALFGVVAVLCAMNSDGLVSVQLVVDNPDPRPTLYEHWEDEAHWHDDQAAEAAGWSQLFAIGFACFGFGCLFTVALAWVITWLR